MSVTIKDVAKLAEVSISTVSRVINNSKPVSSEVKQRVIEAIDELGYIPNEVARSLVTKKSNLIGVVVTDIGNSYIAQMIRGIEEVARMYNYDILLSSSYNELERELKYAQILKNKQAEGIIMIAEDYNKETIKTLREFNKPFLYLNRYNKSEEIFTVSLDNKKSIKSMMDYLGNMGHKNIIYLSSDKYDENSVEKLKISGYEEFIAENNLKKNILSLKGYSFDDGYNNGEKIISMARQEGITAIFCSYDELAIGLLNYCYDNSIEVPEEISVVGYGNIKISSLYRPRLTTVIEPYYDIGAVAIRKIIKDINGEESIDESTYLPDRIFEGESVRKLN